MGGVQICDMFKEHTNNAVVLSGDSHDAWAFTLTSSGDGETGDEVGVNLGTPGVASPGWLAYLPPLQSMGMDGSFAPPADDDGSWAPLGAAGFEANNKLWTASNPGLKYANVKDKGFIAVKVGQGSSGSCQCGRIHLNDWPKCRFFKTTGYQDRAHLGVHLDHG